MRAMLKNLDDYLPWTMGLGFDSGEYSTHCIAADQLKFLGHADFRKVRARSPSTDVNGRRCPGPGVRRVPGRGIPWARPSRGLYLSTLGIIQPYRDSEEPSQVPPKPCPIAWLARTIGRDIAIEADIQEPSWQTALAPGSSGCSLVATAM